MRRSLLLYGFALALAAMLMKWLEYRLFARSLSIEVYVAVVAVFFAALGIWTGRWLTAGTRRVIAAAEPLGAPTPETILASPSGAPGISPREFEVLCLLAEGCSNQEIADRLFVSLPTVKSHTTNLYAKLDVKRRTQAVQRAKELAILS